MRQGLQLCGSQVLLHPEPAPPSFPALPHPESGDDTEKLCQQPKVLAGSAIEAGNLQTQVMALK